MDTLIRAAKDEEAEEAAKVCEAVAEGQWDDTFENDCAELTCAGMIRKRISARARGEMLMTPKT